MQKTIFGGVSVALCVILGMGSAVYAQQKSESPNEAPSYKEQNLRLQESLHQGITRVQEKQKALMEWIQKGSQQLQADQQQMDVMKRGLEQLESNRQYLEWLQEGIRQLQEEQAFMDSLREDMEHLQRTQQQTIQAWLENQTRQAEATEMERTRTETKRRDAEKKLIEEAEQVKASEAEIKRLEDARRDAEKKLIEETEQAEAAAMQLRQAITARQEAEKKLAEETPHAAVADSELKRMESARIEAEQKRAEASKRAEEFEKMQAEMARLEADQDKIDKWLKTDPPKTSETSLGQLGSMTSELPAACAERLEVAHRQFADQGFSKELWLQHVFECQECCAPILNDVMDQHVALVVQQPHTVVLFDFDQYTIKDKYKEQLQALMTTAFDASRDKVLLIGRASKIGDRGYNIALSGKRAGEIRDYLTTTFDVAEEQIRYQFFGADPPQLTLDYAAQYGLSTEDLVVVDANATKAEAKVNQSVEVIIYKGSEINEALNASKGTGTNKHGGSSKP